MMELKQNDVLVGTQWAIQRKNSLEAIHKLLYYSWYVLEE